MLSYAHAVLMPLNTMTNEQQLIFTVVSEKFDTIAVVLLLVIVHKLLNGHSTRNRKPCYYTLDIGNANSFVWKFYASEKEM